MNKKALKFNNIKLIKKEFKLIKKGFKYFIGYQKGDIVKALCIILPQMNGCIKYFENGGKNMSFMIKDDKVWDKYDKIWNVIKDKLGIKFHSEAFCEYKYLRVLNINI